MTIRRGPSFLARRGRGAWPTLAYSYSSPHCGSRHRLVVGANEQGTRRRIRSTSPLDERAPTNLETVDSICPAWLEIDGPLSSTSGRIERDTGLCDFRRLRRRPRRLCAFCRSRGQCRESRRGERCCEAAKLNLRRLREEGEQRLPTPTPRSFLSSPYPPLPPSTSVQR